MASSGRPYRAAVRWTLAVAAGLGVMGCGDENHGPTDGQDPTNVPSSGGSQGTGSLPGAGPASGGSSSDGSEPGTDPQSVKPIWHAGDVLLRDATWDFRHSDYTLNANGSIATQNGAVVTTTLHTKVIENDLVKVTLAPDFGGRLLSIVYKPTNHELLYQNSVGQPYGQPGSSAAIWDWSLYRTVGGAFLEVLHSGADSEPAGQIMAGDVSADGGTRQVHIGERERRSSSLSYTLQTGNVASSVQESSSYQSAIDFDAETTSCRTDSGRAG